MPSAIYSTKLTADTSQHDKAINKSAQQVYQYKKQSESTQKTLTDLAGKVGKFAAGLGIAATASQVLTQAIKSTEAGTDTFERTVSTAKTSVDHFFKAISTGSFSSFLNGLGDIVTTAREAYNALDDLGTMKMWNTMRQNQLRAMIAEDRVIVNNPNSSASEVKAAQQRIELNMQKIQALTGDLIKGTETATDAVLKKIAGSQHSVYQLREFMAMRENGTLEEEMRKYKERMSRDVTVTRSIGGGNTGYTQQVKGIETIWNNRYARETYEAMQRIYNATDDEVKEWIGLQEEISALRTNVANEQIKANRSINKGESGNSTGGNKPTAQAGSLTEIESKIRELENRLKNEAYDAANVAEIKRQIAELENERAAIELKMQFGDLGDTPEEVAHNMATIIDNYLSAQPVELPVTIDEQVAVDAWNGVQEAIEKEWQKFVDERQKELDELVASTGEYNNILSSTGQIFTSIGELGDENFQRIVGGTGNVIAAMGNAIGTIGQTIAQYNALALSKGVASAAELPFPYNLSAIASVVAAVMSVIGTIAAESHKRYANGGIVSGTTTVGDMQLARVNSGEMILNGTQQHRLFAMLNGNTQVNAVTDNGDVQFILRGADLYGSFTNYTHKRNKVL